LVQHCPTLFKRVDIPAMFATLDKRKAGPVPIVERQPVSARETGDTKEGAASDNGRGAVEGVLAPDVETGWGAGGQGESAAVCIECTVVPAYADPPMCVATEAACPQAGSAVSATHHRPHLRRLINTSAGVARSEFSEYIRLQADLEKWVTERKARTDVSATQPANEPSVPNHIKRKLHRLAALRQELVQAACAQAEDTVTAAHPKTRLTRFLNAFAERVSGRGWQRRAVVVADTAAGDAVGGGTGVGIASQGGRSRQGPEGDEDKCLICCGGEPVP
jgi:hypothetical protein